MKKLNSQAETHSNRVGLLRASPANCGFLKHNAHATTLVIAYLTRIFLFFNRLQAQAYSRGRRALRGSPAQRYFFLFIHRLQAQAQARPRPGVKHHATEARTTVIFY